MGKNCDHFGIGEHLRQDNGAVARPLATFPSLTSKHQENGKEAVKLP